MNRQFMRTLLVEESFAYGFTIAFWGSGLLINNEYDLLHTAGILAYAAGAITGFGILAILTFGSPVDTVETKESSSLYVLAAIHYLASLVPIVITHFLLAAALGQWLTLALVGVVVSVSYNLLLGLEEWLSALLWRVERSEDTTEE